MTVFLYRQGNLETSRGKGRVSVLHPCLCVGGGGSWLVGSVLSLLMLSSRKPLTGSIHATSVAASRVEQALSEVASSLQSSTPKQGPLHPWMTLAQIWLHAGMLCPAVGPAPPTVGPGPEAAGSRGHCLRSPQPLSRKSRSFGSHTKMLVQWSPLSAEDMFWAPQWMLGTLDGIELSVYCFSFSYTPMVKFNL